jgi:ATPase subunit of ABC transporter with duplicated ATPase domains
LLLLLLLSWHWQVLTGETEATEGTVWKHPNLRIAYVAQHAFHHIGASLA